VKLIIAIIQNEDANSLSDALTSERFSVTRLDTSGGFLKMGNTTLLIGTQDDKVQSALEIIKNHSLSRNRILPAAAPFAPTDSSISSPMVTGQIGGATVFLIDVESHYKF
jgi:uncharacterized protein YaaQ